MSWQQWVLVVVFTLSALLNVLAVGKERVPITPGLAVGLLVTNALLVALVVTA